MRTNRVHQRRKPRRAFPVLSSSGIALLFAALVMLSLRASVVDASLVLQTSLAKMWAGSALVFEGRVSDLRSERDVRSGAIHTWVRFEVSSVLKGRFERPSLELRFLGGEADGLREEVVGLRIPALGERGVYFVESLTHFQANPLFGWDQGRLRIVRDRFGRDRIVSARGDPILGVETETAVSTNRTLRAAGALRSRGVVEGLRAESAAPVEDALTPLELELRLRGLFGRRVR